MFIDFVIQGCSIFISPIVGEKEVLMVHRDDGESLQSTVQQNFQIKYEIPVCLFFVARLIYNCIAPLTVPDFVTYPLSAYARTWKVVLLPGDVLVMPAGTFHAARNLTPVSNHIILSLSILVLTFFYKYNFIYMYNQCLSYSKFHMDEYDLPYFLNSWMNRDAPTIPHSDICNSTNYLICKLLHIVVYYKKYIITFCSQCGMHAWNSFISWTFLQTLP